MDNDNGLSCKKRLPIASFDELNVPEKAGCSRKKYDGEGGVCNSLETYIEQPSKLRGEKDAPYTTSHWNIVPYITSSIVGALLGVLIIWTLYAS